MLALERTAGALVARAVGHVVTAAGSESGTWSEHSGAVRGVVRGVPEPLSVKGGGNELAMDGLAVLKRCLSRSEDRFSHDTFASMLLWLGEPGGRTRKYGT